MKGFKNFLDILMEFIKHIMEQDFKNYYIKILYVDRKQILAKVSKTIINSYQTHTFYVTEFYIVKSLTSLIITHAKYLLY